LQEAGLPERIKVWEALELFAALASFPADWGTLMEQWGLAGKREASFVELSGGQRQRLFVALALIGNPELVFLDEMTTGLDPAARRVAWRLIQDIRDRGATVVLVTHFMDEAEQLCDRVAIVNEGRLLAAGTPRELADAHGRPSRVTFTGPESDLPWLGQIDHVRSVKRTGSRFEVEGSGPVLALVASGLVAHGVVPADLGVQKPTLEDAFLSLTGETAE
jgi:ABC-2 type transport system ATP-binding protein